MLPAPAALCLRLGRPPTFAPLSRLRLGRPPAFAPLSRLRLGRPTVIAPLSRLFSSTRNHSGEEGGKLQPWPWIPPDLPQDQSRELAKIRRTLDFWHLKPGSPWGFAVFRTAYGHGTDGPWQHILGLLQASVQDSCALYTNADGLLDRHLLVPMEDAARLSGKSSHEVRDVFKEWSAGELVKWLPKVDEGDYERILHSQADNIGPDWNMGTRYNFCLFVDDLCIESVQHMTPPVVKLLWKHWGPLQPHERNYEVYPGWEDGQTEHDEEDVGWMYMDPIEYVDSYGSLEDTAHWHDMQCRPPGMYFRDEKKLPGYWRKTRSGKKLESSRDEA